MPRSSIIRFTDTSVDPEEHRLSYLWEYGDGESSDASSPSHTYDDAGSYTITLTVTDDEGETDTTSVSIRIDQKPSEPGGGIPGFPIASVTIGALLGALILSKLNGLNRREII